MSETPDRPQGAGRLDGLTGKYPVKPTWPASGRRPRFGGGGDRYTHGIGPWSMSGQRFPLSVGDLIAPALYVALFTLYTWAVLQPRHPIPPPTTDRRDFDDGPPVAGPNYHLHPMPTVPVWSWSNRLSEVYDDFIRITLHCDADGSCHVEVESFRIR